MSIPGTCARPHRRRARHAHRGPLRRVHRGARTLATTRGKRRPRRPACPRRGRARGLNATRRTAQRRYRCCATCMDARGVADDMLIDPPAGPPWTNSPTGPCRRTWSLPPDRPNTPPTTVYVTAAPTAWPRDGRPKPRKQIGRAHQPPIHSFPCLTCPRPETNDNYVGSARLSIVDELVALDWRLGEPGRQSRRLAGAPGPRAAPTVANLGRVKGAFRRGPRPRTRTRREPGPAGRIDARPAGLGACPPRSL